MHKSCTSAKLLFCFNPLNENSASVAGLPFASSRNHFKSFRSASKESRKTYVLGVEVSRTVEKRSILVRYIRPVFSCPCQIHTIVLHLLLLKEPPRSTFSAIYVLSWQHLLPASIMPSIGSNCTLLCPTLLFQRCTLSWLGTSDLITVRNSMRSREQLLAVPLFSPPGH